jgi:RNA polymerase sigma factor for flagellar operon FliA
LNDLNGLEVHSLQVGPSWDGKEEDQCDCWANATEDTPLFHRMRSEMKELLTSMIADLPEQQRRVLALYYFEELTMKQVGTALGIGESRVSQVHGSAVANLRRQMENVLNAGKPATRAARAGQ